VSARNPRVIIYQALPRLFGNRVKNPVIDGDIQQNGCGKFADFSHRALHKIRDLGATHLWLTGIHEQASATSYPARPADPPDILKGKAGSPYAVKDYFDVCPDYAIDPDRRLEEFRALLQRCAVVGLKVVIDFIPNHVARSYQSDVRPDLSFGTSDDSSAFFHRDNNFFYVQPSQDPSGPPLRLPTAHMPGCSGHFMPEQEHVKVTGNNAVTFSPGINDWYETVKLNYGHDFLTGRDTSDLPPLGTPPEYVPDTWRKMDEIIAYWQQMGVAGFRVDMAHMVPLEFWTWLIERAHRRVPDVYFFGEAYDNDPAKLTDANVLEAMLHAGFDSVYDDPAYDLCMGIYDDFLGGLKWANDLDAISQSAEFFHQALRYAENHDEVRLATPLEWAGLGMKVGRPVSAVLFALGRGPIMLYHGQEVGEPALGVKGFAGDNGRTSIFDYYPMPEFQKWFADGACDGSGLSPEQKEMREWYQRLMNLMHREAFAHGEFYGLNHANLWNERFGRMPGETASGHWLYAFLRHDAETRQTYLIAANFHASEAMTDVHIQFPEHAIEWLGWDASCRIEFREVLAGEEMVSSFARDLPEHGLRIQGMPACSAKVFECRAGLP
jgi:glycosidase